MVKDRKENTPTAHPKFLNFFIPGIPEPQPRPRFARAAWGVRTYVERGAWYRQVLAIALKNRPRLPLVGPLSLSCLFTHPRPKSAKCGAMWKATRPDLSNLVKLIEDAFQDANLFKDDAQICRIDAEKVLADSADAGCGITLEEME